MIKFNFFKKIGKRLGWTKNDLSKNYGNIWWDHVMQNFLSKSNSNEQELTSRAQTILKTHNPKKDDKSGSPLFADWLIFDSWCFINKVFISWVV